MEIITNYLGNQELVKVEPQDIIDGVLNIPEGVEEIADFLMVNAREVDTGEGCEYIVNPIEGVTDVVKTINVPSTVEIIGEGAFAELSALEHLNFAKKSLLRDMGRCACAGCSSLVDIKIPKGVAELDVGTFKNCSKLTNLSFEEGSDLFVVQHGCFSDCLSLKTPNFPKSLLWIWGRAFYNCKSMTDLDLNNVSEIYSEAFCGCKKIKEAKIRDGIYVAEDAFDKGVNVVKVKDEEYNKEPTEKKEQTSLKKSSKLETVGTKIKNIFGL